MRQYQFVVTEASHFGRKSSRAILGMAIALQRGVFVKEQLTTFDAISDSAFNNGSCRNLAPANVPGIEEGDEGGKPVSNLRLDPGEERTEQTEAPANVPGIEEGDEGGGTSNMYMKADKLIISTWRLSHHWGIAGG